MSTITEYLTEAELALAAYATLTPGMSKDVYVDALQDDGNGMAKKQAEEFAAHWQVIDQYNGQVQDSYYDDFGQLVTCRNSGDSISNLSNRKQATFSTILFLGNR